MKTLKLYNVGNRFMNTYVYAIDGGYVMIDTGYENSFDSVYIKLKQYGISFHDIKYVFLTHAHDDHAGFLNELFSKYPNIKVIMNGKAKNVLARGENSFHGGCSGLVSFVFCKLMGLFGKGEHTFPPVETQYFDRLMEVSSKNKEDLERKLKGKILFTPGHTKDSISLMLSNGIIFCGDAAMNGIPSIKRITIWMENKNEYKKSWELLIAQKSKKLYPAHGKPFSDKDLKKYREQIDQVKLYRLKQKGTL